MQIEDKTTRSTDNGLLKPLIDLKVVPVPLILIHEISAAVERNKKWGAENKIGQSIFCAHHHLSPIPQEVIKGGLCLLFKTPTTFWTLRICRMQSSMVPTTKLHRIAYHRRVGGRRGRECGWKNEKSQFSRLRTLFLVLNRRVDVYLNFPKWCF